MTAATSSKMTEAAALARDLREHLQVDIFTSTATKPQRKGISEFAQTPSKPRPTAVQSADASVRQNARLCEKMESAVQDMTEWMQRLKHAQASKAGPLKLCEYRAGLWSRRPNLTEGDVSKDYLTEVLESEMKTLRQDMAELLTSLKQIQDELKMLRTKLIVARQQTLGLLSHLANGRLIEAEEEQSNLRRVPELQQAAMEAWRKSEAMMARTEEECSRASDRTVQVIERRIADFSQQKKQLERACQETDTAIIAGQQQLLRAKQRLKAQERFGDQVQVQADGLNTTRGMVEKLTILRDELANELRQSNAMLKIAGQCKKCTIDKTNIPVNRTSAVQYVATLKMPKSASTPALAVGEDADSMESTAATGTSLVGVGTPDGEVRPASATLGGSAP
eukprot:CAMPEP_0178371258 /NCGR_PEP_ID=MMETSP0689_2-20121128/732_1 /TAXON_ID=160604 /ORGANISM="Amphidinium massartii, Strain CS-259" /LENGTH=393 /DNA_ID=CAMNT_0019991119 /DNA_START=139 /DNA_END=1317 /DNA_ORIENTATION=-